MKRAQIDFTTGPIAKSLLLYFLPVLAGWLFQQLYSTADAVILAQFAGKAGLAAIDSIYNLLKLPVNFFVGLSTGATIIISQFFGAKDEKKLGEAVHTAVGFSIAGGAVLSVLCVLAADSLGAAVSTFVAQNVGAKQLKRARRGTHIGLGLSLSMILLISAVLYVWCEPLGRLILNESDAHLAGIAGRLMRLMAPLYFLYVFGEVFGGALRGEGETFIPMVITLLGTCATRVLWILFVPHHYNLLLIFAVYPVSWAIASLGMTVYYYCRLWRRQSLKRKAA